MNHNFLTPGGLKIRLNPGYFFYQLVGENRYYTDEEMVNNDTMYNATLNIESMFTLPTTLIQVFSLFAVIFKFDILTFFGVSIALYILGCICRCINPGKCVTPNGIIILFSSLYIKLWLLFYIAIIVLIYVLSSTYLIFPYVIMRLAVFLISLFFNYLSISISEKKFGMPFNDTEICAFSVFRVLLKSKESLSDYITNYVLFLSKEEIR